MSYYLVNLEEYYCNCGFSFINQRENGDFTGSGSSYPAEQLPSSEKVIKIHEVPFHFPSKEKGKFNNIEFNEQKIKVKEDSYQAIHVLGAADNGSFLEPISLIDQQGSVSKVMLGFTDWVDYEPKFNDLKAIVCKGVHSAQLGCLEGMQCTIWYQKVKVPTGVLFNEIRLGDNPGMHIFSLTLERSTKNVR
ncbi:MULTISPECIES: hypothetical protein [Cytobacillus]|uniref:hypothetical protein n=1 Tax=Cytobacillus TaxID=2675230 RepID=UPI0013581CA9|nr:hypothetical protein [Cytobacillus sp. AMY 15.2]KAF0815848.1 hypothetical protein KIS4809_5387 [Bacillus sp. ZZV12-4809]MCM3094272.1 hypothetical protein [Cytobacillus sp. AMY 15.2]